MFRKEDLPYSVVKSKPKLSKNLSEQRKKLHFEIDWLRVRQESSRPIRWRSEAKPKKPIYTYDSQLKKALKRLVQKYVRNKALTLSGRDSMVINLEFSPAEKVTWPDTGDTSLAGSPPLLAVIFQETDTTPKVPLLRKTSKRALSVLVSDSSE